MNRKSITTVLLVEDNPADARLLREMLKEQGSHATEVTHVTCMSEAEKHLAEHAVDIILLDLGLPDAQGLEAVRRAHAAAPRAHLVVLTGLDDDLLAGQALLEGAEDYLVKGQIESRGLRHMLRTAIERRKCEEALLVEKERAQVTLDSVREAVARMARDDVRYPIRLLTVAFVLTIATFAWFGWVIFDSGRGQELFMIRLSRTEQLQSIIVHLDEVLTTSARMAVETGDSRWEKRYRHVEPQLDAAIKETVRLGSNSAGIRFANRTDEANAQLVKMEKRAFALIPAGRTEEAKAILSSPEYKTQKSIYIGGVESFANEIRREINERVRREERVDLLSVIAAVIVGGISFLAWFSTVRGIQRWRVALEGSISDRTLSTIARDITERKDAEKHLSQMEGRYRGLLEAAPDAMVVVNRRGEIVLLNVQAEKQFGYRRDELVGQQVKNIIPEGFAERLIADGTRSAAERLAQQIGMGIELSGRRKNGSEFPIEIMLSPLESAEGILVTAAIRDISVRRDAEKHLAQMEGQLRQAQKMEAVGQLAAGVAHEFNNLLQALMSMAAIMRLRAGTSEIAKIGTEMEFQIKRGAGLTQQLLMFSRNHAMEKAGLDLREQVQKTSVLLRQLIPATIRTVVETSPEQLSVLGDAGQMQQVLLNLAINARDAMPAGGTLTLRAGSRHGAQFLEVEDTGHGMDEATRAHIFEPFFTTKELGQGTGLGLAVVYGIVEQHGGRIEVESRLGQGSCFRVILPAAVYKGVPTPEPSGDAEVLVGSGRVLLVEDEEGVRGGIAALLEMIGYEVTAVGSGEEAIAIPLEPVPDLLLSDLTLPGITGLALGERLRQRWPLLKVVLMSGYIEEALRASASERGWHFLQKPFELTDLASHLRAALDEKTPGHASDLTTIRSEVA